MAMTKSERDQLLSLVKKRERVMRTMAQERSAALLADFDAQAAKVYHWDEDETWKAVMEDAEALVRRMEERIAAVCRKRGIPAEFAPYMNLSWHGRGQNGVASRRAELRQAAKSRIAALDREALAKIEAMGLEAQTAVVRDGLESNTAKAFLDGFGTLDALMPPVKVTEVEQLLEAKKAHRGRDYDLMLN